MHGANSHVFQSELAKFNVHRLAPRIPNGEWALDIQRDVKMLLREGEMIEAERSRLHERLDAVPKCADEFLIWFENLGDPDLGADPLFNWLASGSTEEQLNWFLKQELAAEGNFLDLVALTKVKIPASVRFENVLPPMLATVALDAGLAPAPLRDLVCEALYLSNLLTALASNRRYAFHSIGALAVGEVLSPLRAKCVYLGLKRLGYAGKVCPFNLNATDQDDARSWTNEIIAPIVRTYPDLILPIAEGACLRIEASARTYTRYRHELMIAN